jgi:cytochrome c-type protein NapC
MARTLRLFAPRKQVIKPLLVIAFVVLIVLPVLSSVGWIVTELVLTRTSGAEYCGSCHTMAPMTESFEQDVHGGRNSHGVQARCVDCHLPHDNPFIHIVAYGRRAAGDLWAEIFYDVESIDWEARRERKEEFVYDSGCLRCHSRLQDVVLPTSKAVVEHKQYFQGESDKRCVSCHGSVGHESLSTYLQSK